MVSLKIKWVANTASLLIENKGSISLYSKEVKGGGGGWKIIQSFMPPVETLNILWLSLKYSISIREKTWCTFLTLQALDVFTAFLQRGWLPPPPYLRRCFNYKWIGQWLETLQILNKWVWLKWLQCTRLRIEWFRVRSSLNNIMHQLMC